MPNASFRDARATTTHPIPASPATRSYWWRCDPTATFAECKAAADKIVSSNYPNEPYDTDCFKRDHDKLLWDGRYGARRYGGDVWDPEKVTIGQVYREGDEIVCVQHLHKQWHVTCNDLSEARDARRKAHLAKLGQEMRDEIIAQAAKQVEDPANKYFHGKQGALVKESTGLEGLDLGFRDRRAREAKAATAAKSSTKSSTMGGSAKSAATATAKSKPAGSAGVDAKTKTMSATGKSTKSSSATSGGAKAAA